MLQKSGPRRISEANGGMRRCQRLPEVTHPVDPTRPTLNHFKVRARRESSKNTRKPHDIFVAVLGRRRDAGRFFGRPPGQRSKPATLPLTRLQADPKLGT